MSIIDRRTFLSFGGTAAALAVLPLAGCGGGGSGDSYPLVSNAGKGPMGVSKEGRSFQTSANDHTLTITSSGGTKKTVGGLGAGAGKLNYPTGVAVINGLAYVVETGNHRVQVFDGDGVSLGFIGTGELNYPGGIAAGNNEIFVADSRNARVVSFSLAGQVTRVLGAGLLSAPRGLVVVEDGVIVADPGLHRVVKIGFDGALKGDYANGMVLPWDVATDGNFVYVADVSRNELLVASMDGTRINSIPLSQAPANVWYRGDTLYVA
jgi:hypothetical protein